MKAKLFALAAFAALILFSGTAQAGSIMGDSNAYMGIRYSPKDFTAAYLSGISIECTGGNTTSYTTSEIASVTIFSTIEPAVILLPTTYRMSYFTGAGPSTLEVRGVNFNAYHTFVVAFRDSDVIVETGTLETINNVVTVETVNTVSAITTGTLETVKTVNAITTGTLETVKTVNTVGVVSAITTGTLETVKTVNAITTGTLETVNTLNTVGVVSAITTGTLETVKKIDSITTGTIETVNAVGRVATITTGTLETIRIVNTIEAITTGTIETLNTITNPVTIAGTLETVNIVGTVAAITTGTIETLNTITNPVTVTGAITVPNPITAEVKGLVSIEGYATGEVFPKAGYTTSPTTLTFTSPSKSFLVVNYDTTNVLKIDTGWGTLEVDPAVGASREFPFILNSIDVYTGSSTASAEIEVRY